MPLLVFVAATSIACLNPAHRDGQSIRCGEKAPVFQLEGIKVPPILAACTGGLACRDDPGIAARDHLAELTRGQSIVCTLGSGRRKPQTARCMMGGVDLACAMIADGMATATGPLACPPPPPEARLARRLRDIADLPPLWRWVPLYLMLVNIAAFTAVTVDYYRAVRAMTRVAPVHLLMLTFFGGGVGTMLGLWRYAHLRNEQPFISQFAVLIGLQIGTTIGLLLF